MGIFKKIGGNASFKINKRQRMLTKNMKTQDQTELNKIGSKVENQIKYLGINMRNINCMLFQNNYVKTGMK